MQTKNIVQENKELARHYTQEKKAIKNYLKKVLHILIY
jgi:hypothetical protein